MTSTSWNWPLWQSLYQNFLSNVYKSTANLSFKLLQYPKHYSILPCFGSLFAERVLAVYSACSHRAFNLHTRCMFRSQLCDIRSACAHRHKEFMISAHSQCVVYMNFFLIFIVIRNIKVLRKKGHKMIKI